MEGTFTPPLPPPEADVEEMKWSLVEQQIAIEAELHALREFIAHSLWIVDDTAPYFERQEVLNRLDKLVCFERVSWLQRVEDIGDVFDRRLAIVQLHKRYLPVDICRILANGDDLWRAYVDGPNLEPYSVLDDGLPVLPVPIHECEECSATFNTLRQLNKHARGHSVV
jgi:hypothetical protein